MRVAWPVSLLSQALTCVGQWWCHTCDDSASSHAKLETMAGEHKAAMKEQQRRHEHLLAQLNAMKEQLPDSDKALAEARADVANVKAALAKREQELRRLRGDNDALASAKADVQRRLRQTECVLWLGYCDAWCSHVCERCGVGQGNGRS